MLKIDIFLKKIEVKMKLPRWLWLVIAAAIILRLPSFFEPYSYGDETIYLTLGHAVRQGIPLYQGIHDNKPPLLYLTAALAGNLFWFKMILLIWQIAGIIIFWQLIKSLFNKSYSTQRVAVIIYALLTTIPFFEGNIVNAELFMVVPTVFAFIILLFRRQTYLNIFFAGMLFSLASLYKIPAAFDLPVIIVFWFITLKFGKKELIIFLKKVLILGLGFVLPIALTFVWYAVHGAFKEYLIAAYMQNFGYLSSWRPAVKSEPFFVKNGPLLARAGILVLANGLLFLNKKRLSKEYILLSSWLTFSLFGATLSERPYPHYFIQAVPALSGLLAMLFTLQTYEQVLVIIPLTLISVVPVYYKYWHYNSASYYYRFVSFAAGKLSKDQYLSGFGGEVLRNYKIAELVKNSTFPDEKIFVWEDSAQIYALSDRLPPIKYVAGYHIKDFSSNQNLVTELKANMPKLIIILPNSNAPKELVSFTQNNYILIQNIENAQIWLLLGNKE